jgi:hypothetical protein
MGSSFYLTIISSHILLTHLLYSCNLLTWPQQAWWQEATNNIYQTKPWPCAIWWISRFTCVSMLCARDIARNFTISVSFWQSSTIWGTKYVQNEFQAYRLNACVLCLSACQPKWVIVLEVCFCKLSYCDTFRDNPSLSCNSSNSKSTYHFSAVCVMNR